MVLLACGLLLAPSCTRMPTAPRAEVTVVGRVVGPSGEPLPWTDLWFTPDERALEEFKAATTDTTGAYSVRLISGSYRVQVVPPAGGLMPRVERVTVSARHPRVDFAFSGYHVTGSVVDPYGNTVDSGRVDARLPGVGYATTWLQHGTYSLVLPAGTYSLFAASANYDSGFPSLQRDSVTIASDTTINLQLQGILISGKVLGPDGLPMSGVYVEARAIGLYVRNRTGTDGGYRLFVPSGSYQFWFRPPYPFFIIPRVVGPMTITAPTVIDADLSGIEWRGTVRRSDTNEPAPGVTVGVRMIDDPDDRGAAIYTGAQGDFRFIMEANRRYDLVVYDPVRHEQTVAAQRVTATADTTFDILIPPAIVP